MSMGSMHYEVFQRRSKAGGWALHGVFSTRDLAIREARMLMSAAGGRRQG
jgi:hypothetical protein